MVASSSLRLGAGIAATSSRCEKQGSPRRGCAAVPRHGVDVGAVEQRLDRLPGYSDEPDRRSRTGASSAACAASAARRSRPARSAAPARPCAATGAGSAGAADCRSARRAMQSPSGAAGAAAPSVCARISREFAFAATRLRESRRKAKRPGNAEPPAPSQFRLSEITCLRRPARSRAPAAPREAPGLRAP